MSKGMCEVKTQNILRKMINLADISINLFYLYYYSETTVDVNILLSIF